MRRIVVISALCLCFTTPIAADPPKWHPAFDDAVAAAKETNKPIFLVFRCER